MAMDALRILMVADVSPLHIAGGAERVLWEQASRLAKLGHSVRVICRAPREDAPEAIERHGVLIRHFHANRTSDIGLLRTSIRSARMEVSRALAEGPVDVLHCYQPFSALGALQAARHARLLCLYTFLSPAPLEYLTRSGMSSRHRSGVVGRIGQAILWTIERRCLRRAARIQVLSDFSTGQLQRLYGVGRDRVVKIPAGVDLTRFCPAGDRRQVRTRLGLPAEARLLLTVRNLENRMGLELLLQAIALIQDRMSDFRLLIGGTGSLRTRLERLSASLGLGERVAFLGYIPDDDLPSYYQAADAFVLPTRALEGFGLVTVEALACGTPVLGTPVGATEEILRPLDPSLVFESATADDMARGILQFFTDRFQSTEGYQTLRLACRKHAETSYAWERTLSRLEATLGALAGSAGGPP